jgi:hypothetical protein
MKATIARPFYDWDGRKYMELRMEDSGTTLRVKVPWRYNRVMCRVEGIRPIQEFESGESVEVLLYKKVWDGEIFWVLSSIRPA